MSRLGIAYKRVADIEELTEVPANDDYVILVDASAANKEKKIAITKITNPISYESSTVYFENNVVFN